LRPAYVDATCIAQPTAKQSTFIEPPKTFTRPFFGRVECRLFGIRVAAESRQSAIMVHPDNVTPSARSDKFHSNLHILCHRIALKSGPKKVPRCRTRPTVAPGPRRRDNAALSNEDKKSDSMTKRGD
jgi:hypothetical protein